MLLAPFIQIVRSCTAHSARWLPGKARSRTLSRAGLVVFGVILAPLAVFEWWRAGSGWCASAFGLGLLGFALGAGVVAGLFPEDPMGAVETLDGKIHGIGAGLGSVGFLIGLAFGAGLARGRARVAAYALTLLAWTGFVIFLTSKSPDAYTGLWQKMFLGSAYAATLVLAQFFRSRRLHNR